MLPKWMDEAYCGNAPIIKSTIDQWVVTNETKAALYQSLIFKHKVEIQDIREQWEDGK